MVSIIALFLNVAPLYDFHVVLAQNLRRLEAWFVASIMSLLGHGAMSRLLPLHIFLRAKPGHGPRILLHLLLKASRVRQSTASLRRRCSPLIGHLCHDLLYLVDQGSLLVDAACSTGVQVGVEGRPLR